MVGSVHDSFPDQPNSKIFSRGMPVFVGDFRVRKARTAVVLTPHGGHAADREITA